MEKETDNKNTLIVLAIVLFMAVFIVGFFLINKDEEVPTTTIETATGSNTAIIGTNALRLISQIESLKLESKVFDDPNFINLQDRVQDIATEPVGRENPFSDIR